MREVLSIPGAKSRGNLIVRFLEVVLNQYNQTDLVLRFLDDFNGKKNNNHDMMALATS